MSRTTSPGLRPNTHAVFVSVAMVFLASGVTLWLKVSQAGRLRDQVINHAEALLKEGKADQAMRHVNRYLQIREDDVPALDLKARVMADSASTLGQLRDAAQVNDRLLRLDPDGPGRRETRRRLAELYLRYSDAYRAGALFRDTPEVAMYELRYRAAEAIAWQMVQRDAADVAGHRLLGLAREALAVPGDSEALTLAIKSYERALEIDPRDLMSVEHLAGLYHERLKDASRADRVLDSSIADGREGVQVRLARYRCYSRWQEPTRAAAELAAVEKLAPADVGYQLIAADDALRRGKTVEARHHLDSLPEAMRGSLRVRLIRGMIDLQERRPDDALDGWRAGLADSGGMDATLTWWLAYILLRTGRVAEAQPLVTQFGRIVGEETHPQMRFLNALLDMEMGRPLAALAILEHLRDQIDATLLPALLLAQGQCHEVVGDDIHALQAYRESAKTDPKDMAPRFATVRLLESHRPDEAMTYLRREIAANPAEPALKIALARSSVQAQARQPAASRSWRECDDAIESALAASPESPALLLIQADRHSLSGDVAGAVDLLAEATRKTPRDPSAWISYAMGLDRAGKPAESLRALEAAMTAEVAGDQAVLRIAAARLLTAAGRGREARNRLVENADRLPLSDRLSLLEEEGRLLASKGDYQGARTAFSAWAKLAPDSAQPRIASLNLALSIDDQSEVHAIVATLRKIGGPDDITWRLGRVLELLRSPVAGTGASDPATAEARAMLDELSRSAPQLEALPWFRGLLQERQGYLDEAVTEYRLARGRGVESALPRLVAGLTRLRRLDELVALRQGPPDPRLESLLDQAAEQLGNVAGVDALRSTNLKTVEARQARFRVLEAAGQFTEAQKILQTLAGESAGQEAPWLALLQFQLEHDRPEVAAATALIITEKVKTDRPELLKARVLALGGELAAADESIAAALKTHPDDVEILTSASTYYQETARPSKAISLLQRVAELAPNRPGVRRQIATGLASTAKDLPSWGRIWDGLGPETTDPEDRLARAFVLVRCPDPGRRRGAIAMLEGLLADLDADHAVALKARELLARLLLDDGKDASAAEIVKTAACRGFDLDALNIYLEAQLRCKEFASVREQLDRWQGLVPGDRREARWRVRMIQEESPAAEVADRLEQADLGRKDGKAAQVLGVEAFLKLSAMGGVAEVQAARLAGRLVSRDQALSWTLARLANRSGRREDAIRLSLVAVNAPSASKSDLLEAVAAAMTAASSPAAAGRDREAVLGLLKVALEREPREPGLWTGLGMLNHMQSRYDDEINCFREVLRRQPSNWIARNNLAWVFSENKNRPADGLPYVNELLNEIGPAAETLCTRGVILLRLGRADEAIRDLEEARRIKPSPQICYYLACTYAKLKRPDDSRRSLDEALRSGLAPASIDASHRAECEAMVAASGHRGTAALD